MALEGSDLQGLQRGFPIHLLTLMLWVLAWFDYGPVPQGCLCTPVIKGTGVCLGHKVP